MCISTLYTCAWVNESYVVSRYIDNPLRVGGWGQQDEGEGKDPCVLAADTRVRKLMSLDINSLLLVGGHDTSGLHACQWALRAPYMSLREQVA